MKADTRRSKINRMFCYRHARYCCRALYAAFSAMPNLAKLKLYEDISTIGYVGLLTMAAVDVECMRRTPDSSQIASHYFGAMIS
jgi:hypothetical protein